MVAVASVYLYHIFYCFCLCFNRQISVSQTLSLLILISTITTVHCYYCLLLQLFITTGVKYYCLFLILFIGVVPDRYFSLLLPSAFVTLNYYHRMLRSSNTAIIQYSLLLFVIMLILVLVGAINCTKLYNNFCFAPRFIITLMSICEACVYFVYTLTLADRIIYSSVVNYLNISGGCVYYFVLKSGAIMRAFCLHHEVPILVCYVFIVYICLDVGCFKQCNTIGSRYFKLFN